MRPINAHPCTNFAQSVSHTWSRRTRGQKLNTELQNQDQMLIDPSVDFHIAAPYFAS